MNALKNTRPFNIKHAKAGAPYVCADGCKAEILKYTDAMVFGTITNEDGEEFASNWRSGGEKKSGVQHAAKDLVMLPLGYIDGKPVFVGDELTDAFGGIFAATPTDRFGLANSLRWPAPEKQYPVTGMTDKELVAVVKGHPAIFGTARHIANAALRHAIDAGQVVVPPAIIGYQPIKFMVDPARDMAVAEAVARQYTMVISAATSPSRPSMKNGAEWIGEQTADIDLAAIISKVQP